ncbi:MAG TPA: hypothetical protein VKA84_29705 [Gemmatimonadaceae bacterium]|nr:hypothetical protein [Gemmatimonadaceae bacterium]
MQLIAHQHAAVGVGRLRPPLLLGVARGQPSRVDGNGNSNGNDNGDGILTG